MPLTNQEVRLKLLGPAIGIVIGVVFCLSYMLLTIAVGVLNPNPQGQDKDALLFTVLALGTVGTLHIGGMIVGAVAMFRGKGLQMAWIGSIAALLPCSPCCLFCIGFGIWGIVVLCDPRVSRALK